MGVGFMAFAKNILINVCIFNIYVCIFAYQLTTTKTTTMKTFKNKNFKKRNYDCTNVVFCKADIAPNENWVECNEDEINCDQLWVENGIRYFGYL